MKETITDYETVETEKTITHCDYPSCGVTDEEGEVSTLKLYNRENRHYCPQHLAEVVGVEEETVRVEEGQMKIVEETNPLITMPWDYFSEPKSRDSRNFGGMMIMMWPLGLLLALSPCNNYNRGIRDTFLGMLLWVGVPLLLWW